MARSTPILRAGTLIIETAASGERIEIPAESDAWFAWLQSARTFAFDDPGGHFTARKKRRWGADYWYAVRRHGGSLYETYLGKAANITLQRLRMAAANLNELAGRRSPARTDSRPSARHGDSDVSVVRGASSSAARANKPQAQRARLIRTHAVERLRQVTLYPLTIVSAPAGYGKTTLLAQWSETARLATAWLTVDERDNDPARFWRRVCEALAPRVPGLAMATRSSTQLATAQRGGVMLAALIDALPSTPSPTVLILDNYHELRPDNFSVHGGIAELIDHLPPHVHLALASRTVPPLPLAKLRAARHLLEFRAADLQFTLAEADAFLTRHMHVEVSDEQVALLHARTEGWVTGLQLAALSMREQPDVAQWIVQFNGENRYIFDYFVEEVVNPLPPQSRTFVLQTSLLDRMSASLCDAVTQSGNSKAILDDLDRNNVFLVSLDDRRDWYRFHHLFTDALRRYLRLTQPTLAPSLYRRASRWCETRRLTLEAIDYAFAAHEFSRAAQLLEGYLPSALGGNNRTLALERLNRLPDTLVRERPRLCVAHAYLLFILGGDRTRMPQRVRDAEESLERVANLLSPADLGMLRSEILALRASVRFLLGDASPSEALALHQQALAALPRHHALLSFIKLFIGIEQLVNGDVRAAGRTLDALMRASEAHADTLYVGLSLLYLGLALVRQGQLDDALARCRRVAQRLEGQYDENLAARSRSISGTVFYERNDLGRALDAVSQGISLRYDPAPFLMETYPTLAYVYWAVGNGDAAQQMIEQSLAEWAGMQAENMMVWAWTGRHILAHQARLELLEGHIEAASAWARTLERDKRAATASHAQPPAYVSEWEDIVLARTYLSENRARDALALLNELSEEAELAGRKSRLLEILLLQVVAHDAEGNASTAMWTLQRAIELAAPPGFVRAFVEGGPTIKRYLMRLHTECVQRSPSIRWRRKSALRHFIESLLAAFALQDKSGERMHTRHTVPAPGGQVELAPSSPRLTRRQRQILRLVEDGATNQDIATDLVISPATVKRHISNIFTEMGVKNRTKAVTRALELGLLAPEANSETAGEASW